MADQNSTPLKAAARGEKIRAKIKKNNDLLAAAMHLCKLSGTTILNGFSPYCLAIPEAEIAAGVKHVSGNPKDFIRNNLPAIEKHLLLKLNRLKEEDKKTKKEKKKRPKVSKKSKTSTTYYGPPVAVASRKADPKSNDFLMSFEWRVLRMNVLVKYGAVCQCCGASPKTGAVMNVDHIKPRKTHPHLALDFDNLQVLCGPCNHGKSNHDTTDWRVAARL